MATGKLREVELDAVRITEKRFRDQEEDRQYKLSKQKATKVVAIEEESDVQTPELPYGGSTYEPETDKKGTKK